MLRLLITLALLVPGASAPFGPDVLVCDDRVEAAGCPDTRTLPEAGNLSVYLCEDGSPFEKCDDSAITPARQRALEARLRADPRLADVKLQTPADELASFERFDPRTNHDNDLGSGLDEPFETTEADFPFSFTAVVPKQRDRAGIVAEYTTFPGVSTLFILTTPALPVIDFDVRMCGSAESWTVKCRGRGPATHAETVAVAELLKALPGVEMIYWNSAEAVHRTARALDEVREPSAEGGWDRSMYSDQFYVTFAAPGDRGDLIGRLLAMPGVLDAEDHERV